jgi:hypothetical protein
MSPRIDVTLSCVLAVQPVPGGRFVWRHGKAGPWFREGDDVVFPLPDTHPEWARVARARLDLLRAAQPGATISVSASGGLPLCGFVPA